MVKNLKKRKNPDDFRPEIRSICVLEWSGDWVEKSRRDVTLFAKICYKGVNYLHQEAFWLHLLTKKCLAIQKRVYRMIPR